MDFTDQHILDFSKSNNRIPEWFIKSQYTLLIGDGDTTATPKHLDDNIDIFICYPQINPEYFIYLKANIDLINSNPKYTRKHLICIVDVTNPKQCNNFCILFENKFNRIILNKHAEPLNLYYISILLADKGEYFIINTDNFLINPYSRFIEMLNEDLLKNPNEINYSSYLNRKISDTIVIDNHDDIESKNIFLLDKIYYLIENYDFKINIKIDILEQVNKMHSLKQKFINLLCIFGYLLSNFHIKLGDDLYGYIELNEKSNIITRYQKDTELKYMKKYLVYKQKYFNLKKLKYF